MNYTLSWTKCVSEVDAVEQKFRSCFSENKRFTFMTEFSCELERGAWLIPKPLKTSVLVTSCVTSTQGRYHVVWNVHSLNTNHSSVVIDTDLRYTAWRWLRRSVRQCFTFFLRYWRLSVCTLCFRGYVFFRNDFRFFETSFTFGAYKNVCYPIFSISEY
jgi:hypothetical protein